MTTDASPSTTSVSICPDPWCGVLSVRRHCAFASRPVLKPLAICLQRRRKILANTATPYPQGGRHRNVGQGERGTDKEFAVAELITNSVDRRLEPRLDAYGGPIALLIVRRAEADRQEGCHQ